MRRIVLLLIIAGGAWYAWEHDGGRSEAPVVAPGSAHEAARTDDGLAAAFEQRSRGRQVTGSGKVSRLLSDDDEGSRHQRFVVTLASGQTLLVAHNIDVAPRVASLAVGDTVSFHGEYEWNEQGGVIHWTHHDPQGSHAGGWIEHEGRRYE